MMDDEKLNPLVSAEEAATILGIGSQTIRIGLITGAFPFGAAVPSKHDNHILPHMGEKVRAVGCTFKT